MNANIERLARVLLAGFFVVALALGYWQLLRAPDLVAREDNPRLVLAEQRVRRGQILDRDGVVLAYSEPATAPAVAGAVQRRYPYPEAVHAIGYYSLRYGTAGGEAVFDAVLRGSHSRIEQLLHRPPTGADVSLSVAVEAQQAAGQALGSRRGAVVVLSVDTGDLLVLVSHPIYDPNRVDDLWDDLVSDPAAPLLNRATQGVYPVGDLARWIGLAGLLSSGITTPPDPYTTPLPDLLAPLSAMGYLATARQLGFDVLPPIELPVSAGRLPEFDRKGTPRDLAVTPLHMVRFAAAVAGDGQMPRPRLAPGPVVSHGDRAFAPDVAAALRAVMPAQGSLTGWAGVAQTIETGAAPVSWFVGCATVSSPQLAVVVLVEGSSVGAEAVPIAQRAIAALE